MAKKKTSKTPDLGSCYCGCGRPTANGSRFYPGDDGKAVQMILEAFYESDLAVMAEHYGLGPNPKPKMVPFIKAYHAKPAKKAAKHPRPRRPS